MPIRRLSAQTINRIAAGEVIERPAAAVKELVENALDAGAKRVEIILTDGGISRIEVIDDGHGIAADELLLAIERHATSKLADEALVEIGTLGFRGEALPSIGAAARLTLISRPAGQDGAWRVKVSGGEIEAPSPCAGGQGTRAIVEDLFYATPARRKFLRSAHAESDAAERSVWRLALSAPGVAFRLVSNERVMFDVPGQSEAARVAALFGRDTAFALIPLEAERDGVRLTGLVGPASLSRATTALQSFVVNGRPVVDPLLKMALRLAYRDVITNGRHPVAALRLSVPAGALDVNVHPAKTELRFADANGIRGLVIGALNRLLAAPVAGGAVAGSPATARQGAEGFAGAGWPVAGGAVAANDPMLVLRPAPRGESRWRPSPVSARASGFAEAELALLAPPIELALQGLPAARQFAAAAPDPAHPLGAPVAQIFDTYILAVAADGALILVDQHAAHERLTEERLRAEFSAGAVAAQALLVPVVVDLAPVEAMRLLAQAETLARLGLEIEAFGPGAVLVRAVPAALKDADAGAMLRDLAEEFAESETALALEAKLDSALARLACHRSIRAGRRLAPAEMSALLREMEATPRAATCSHGRPTFLRLSRGALEKMFGR
jgi:DNA mismatch repair protein MutL